MLKQIDKKPKHLDYYFFHNMYIPAILIIIQIFVPILEEIGAGGAFSLQLYYYVCKSELKMLQTIFF